MNQHLNNPEPQTISDLLDLRCSLTPNAPAWLFRSASSGGRWTTRDWSSIRSESLRFASAFRRAGLAPEARVAFLLGSSPLWEPLAHAVYRNRCALVALDCAAGPGELAGVLRQCEASMLVTDADGWRKIGQVRHALGSLKTILVDGDASQTSPDGCLSLGWLMAQSQGDESPDGATGSRPDDLATIVFTSGTTGTPKGIPYRQEQIMAACHALVGACPELGVDDRTICWLPQSALFQRMVNLLSMACGMKSYLVENPRAIFQEMEDIRPTFFIGVPHFYQKLDEELAGNKAASLGKALEEVKLMISGSAPIRVEVLASLQARGIAVREAYGVSENTVPVALNRLSEYRFGTVGKPLAPNEVRLADDGEVLVKGPGLFSGYLGEQAESDRFTTDGFYRTGDLGRLDEAGYLVLTGRKCDLIKTSTGRRIAPSKVEAAYLACPRVNQIIVIGSGRKYLAALVTPATSWSEAGVQSRESLDEFQSELVAAGRALSSHEQVLAFGLLPAPFGTGEITSSQKLRRAAIIEKYSELIERLYDGAPPYIVRLDQSLRLPEYV